jgi:hypothetical protein
MARNKTSIRRVLTRLRAPVDRRVLFEAALLTPLVALSLRTIGLTRLQGLLERRSPRPKRSNVAEARHIAQVVDIVVRRSPVRHNCLRRSVVLWHVLHRHALEADLRIGVGRELRDDRQFHAWVEHAGTVLNDDEQVLSQYIPFGANKSAREQAN